MKLKILDDKNFLELLKGSSISFVAKVVGMLLGYGCMLFITNIYGASEWGLYSLSITVLSILAIVPKFGLDYSLVRVIAEIKNTQSRKDIIKVIARALVISLFLGLLIISLIELFSAFITDQFLVDEKADLKIYLISYTIIPIVVLTIVGAVYQAFKNPFLYIIFQTALLNFMFLSGLMLNYFFEFNLEIFELYFYAAIVSSVIAVFSLAYKISRNQEAPKELEEGQSYPLKKLIKLSFPMMLSSSVTLLMGWSDILMLSYFKTTFDIGIYNSALKLAALPGIALIAINSIAAPKFVEYYTKSDMGNLEKTVKQSTKMIFFTTFPLLLILVFFSKWILGIFGSEFIVGYMALIYLCISRFINAASGSVGYIMQMTDQQKTFQNVIILAFLINLLLNYLLIPIFSYTGAAIASSIAMVFWNVTLVFIIRKKFGFWTIYIPFLNK